MLRMCASRPFPKPSQSIWFAKSTMWVTIVWAKITSKRSSRKLLGSLSLWTFMCFNQVLIEFRWKLFCDCDLCLWGWCELLTSLSAHWCVLTSYVCSKSLLRLPFVFLMLIWALNWFIRFNSCVWGGPLAWLEWNVGLCFESECGVLLCAAATRGHRSAFGRAFCRATKPKCFSVWYIVPYYYSV